MATIETLRDDNLQTLPQDLTDQEAQTVIFTPESTKGEDKELISPEELKEIKKMINERILEIKDYAKSSEGIQGWNRAEKLLDDLGNDIMNILDDKTINLGYFMMFYIGNTLGNLDNGCPAPEIPEEKMKEVAKEIISFINKLIKLIEKYANKIINMFNSGLKNNFKSVPEPMKSHFIENKEKIGTLVKNLGRWAELCKKLGEGLSKAIKNNGSSIEVEKISEDLSKELETLLDNQPCTLSELGDDLLDVFFCFPFDLVKVGEENGITKYETSDEKSLVENIDKLPENACVCFQSSTSKIEIYGNKKVRLINYSDNEFTLDNLEWSLESDNFYIKDKKGNIIWDTIDWHMEKNVRYLSNDLAEYLSHFGKSFRSGPDFNRLEVIEGNALSKLKCEFIALGKKSIDDKKFATELTKFGGKTIYLEGLKELTPEIARELGKFKGELVLTGLKYITPETARELAESACSKINLYGLDDIDYEVAKILVPIKSKLHLKENVKTQIENAVVIMDDVLGELQNKIENINKGINWGGKRGNIEFDWNANTIKSWGGSVKVEKIYGKSIKLEGLGVTLTLKEGLWLANFKNRLKYTYGDQKVEHTRGIKSLFYTYYVGTTQIIERETLEKFCPMCKNGLVREKIKDWLNK